MTPDYEGMLVSFLVFTVAPLVAVGVSVVVVKARARGRRLFVDLPAKRLGPPPTKFPQLDHSYDGFR